jgi:UDP-galactopyranose mutase
MPWEAEDQTVCFKEYSKLADENDTPYYPLRLEGDKELLKDYIRVAEQEKR